MRILVDADACPVKQLIEQIARDKQIEVIFVSNYHHLLESTYGQVIVVDGQSQSADLAIVNMGEKGDIVVTSDYGLAAMALGRELLVLSSDGRIFCEKNIDQLLSLRHVFLKARRNGRIKGRIPKRTGELDGKFKSALLSMLETPLVDE